jgi:hypothetical protein
MGITQAWSISGSSQISHKKTPIEALSTDRTTEEYESFILERVADTERSLCRAKLSRSKSQK